MIIVVVQTVTGEAGLYYASIPHLTAVYGRGANRPNQPRGRHLGSRSEPEESGAMTSFDTPYDRVKKLPKRFKPLTAYDDELRRGLVHTPEYDQQMTGLKQEFQSWLLSEGGASDSGT